LILFLFLAEAVHAQDDEKPTFPLETIYAKRKSYPLRTVFRNVKFSASIGAGNTFFRHELNGFSVIQQSGKEPRIFPSGPNPLPRYSNWVNEVVEDTAPVLPDSYIVSSDTAKLGFKGNGFNIPIHLSIHYEFKKFRIGGGYGFEPMFIGDFKPVTFSDKIGSFKPGNSSGIMKKYYGMLGYSFYRVQNYLFTGNLQIGGYQPGKNFARELIQKGVNVNLGVTVERELSEYWRLFAKPSLDFKKYTLTVPGSGDKSIKHNLNAVYVQVGFTYSIPDLPKCFHHECKIQMNHAHGNKEYRSRVHPFYKKQNPNYGENHPTLIKYKGKNKRKLNPY
jgi:hypothetical protein